MRLRSLAALAALLFVAAPALAEPPKPAVVVQAKPIFRLLNDHREMLRQVGGPEQGDKLVKEFDRDIKNTLGEQGFEGIDTNRPLGGYVVLRDEIKDASIVLLVPVAGEKEFIALLERLKMKVEPVKDKKGVYSVAFPDVNLFPKDSHVQFVGPWAYVCLNEGDLTDAKNLLAPADLLDNADQSLASVKIYPGRVPEKLLKNALDQMDMAANGIKGFFGAGGVPKHIAKMMTAFFDEGPKLVRRYAETGVKEASEVGVRFTWDPMSGDTVTELTLVPKPGTPLAKEIAARPATANRFAGLVPKNAAVGGVIKAPLFAPEIREIVAAALEAGVEELKGDGGLPEMFHKLADEIGSSLVASVKKGELDGAFALVGPDKNGKFTFVGAASLEDAPKIEKALRQVARAAAIAKDFEFNAAKVGDVGIHKVPLLIAAPDGPRREFAKFLGENAPSYVAFDKDAAFLAVGPDALEAVKAALAVKPCPAPHIDLTANMKSLHKLVGAVGGEQSATTFAKFLGTDDKAVNILRITDAGGEKLTVKITVNVRYIPKFFLVAEGAASVKPPLPPPGK